MFTLDMTDFQRLAASLVGALLLTAASVAGVAAAADRAAAPAVAAVAVK